MATNQVCSSLLVAAIKAGASRQHVAAISASLARVAIAHGSTKDQQLEEQFEFDMEEQLSALTEIDNVYVVAIFDCCREDISRLAKDSGARASDSAAGGNFLVLYGGKNSGKRDTDNLMAPTLEANI